MELERDDELDVIDPDWVVDVGLLALLLEVEERDEELVVWPDEVVCVLPDCVDEVERAVVVVDVPVDIEVVLLLLEDELELIELLRELDTVDV